MTDLIRFCEREAEGLDNHAKLVARSHGEQDRAAVYSRERAETFRRIAAALRELRP